MIKLGIVGTNWISKAFLEAALATGLYEYSALYSRKEETGVAFGAPHIETNFEAFATLDLDMVYIASPNSVHFDQAKTLIRTGKNLIVEKPVFSNIRELNEVLDLAHQYGVYVFEAARHIHEPNFNLLKQRMGEIGDIVGANFTFMKYSSRYDQVLAGQVPNIFSLSFSGGALMDLGIYLVYASIALFGTPKSATYVCKKIETGVDGIGTITFSYDDFEVVMCTGKIADSNARSEIYGVNGTVSVNGVAAIDDLRVNHRGHMSENLAEVPEEIGMIEEAKVFADIYLNKKTEEYEKLCQLARDVHEWMTLLRYQAGIKFDAD